MANLTLFQRLSKVFSSNSSISNNYQMENPATNSGELLRTTDKGEYERHKIQGAQAHLLAKQWIKAGYDITNKSIANLSNIKMMYRDADLMDDFPEIGAALDIVMEECTCVNRNGFLVNVTSKSERIQTILEDLFVNRLSINTILPMICRSTCKYGNTFMLLNIDEHQGIIGWRQLPVYEMERFENGMDNPYAAAYTNLSNVKPEHDEGTKFVWIGQNDFIPYLNWQIAHFRLLYNSLYLPYGMSFLNKARRHFRMLSMMEDMMLIYRLDRSVERRVFKINVGAIDEADVYAYVQEIANNFKRTPIIDPMTGQVDLRKNLLATQSDYFIPVRDDSTPSPIETLSAAQNPTTMDDIKFIENKVITALRVPKAFLNFEESRGEGRNLSLLDIRFARTVARIQQSLIMELNKVAMIHLILLGFEDDVTNFSITMNSPSSQTETLELENLSKKLQIARDALSDSGNGIPVMSATRVWRSVFKWSDREISDNLEEIRLERALAAELEKTNDIIKRTGIFDPVDNIYGEKGSGYTSEGDEGDLGGGNKSAPSSGEAFGSGGLYGGGYESFEGGGALEGGEENVGEEGEMPLSDVAAEEAESMGESIVRRGVTRKQKKNMGSPELYIEMMRRRMQKEATERSQRLPDTVPLFSKAFIVNEELDRLYHDISVMETEKDTVPRNRESQPSS